jgi:hypothetical protein
MFSADKHFFRKSFWPAKIAPTLFPTAMVLPRSSAIPTTLLVISVSRYYQGLRYSIMTRSGAMPPLRHCVLRWRPASAVRGPKQRRSWLLQEFLHFISWIDLPVMVSGPMWRQASGVFIRDGRLKAKDPTSTLTPRSVSARSSPLDRVRHFSQRCGFITYQMLVSKKIIGVLILLFL